jgi:hypothetical protein
LHPAGVLFLLDVRPFRRQTPAAGLAASDDALAALID